ncbi:MAG: DUF4157 domain-containing protein [Candidatus Atribacteria bacterium]|nr:MAG: DUF4157 domain-containing protein [Candidatus Atribacteria bacterium]
MNRRERVAESILENKNDNISPRVRKVDIARSSGSLADRVMFLQRTIGNQAVESMIRSRTLQTKLRIGQPGDKYEQEADRVADQMVRMPEPQIVSGNNLHIQRAYPGFEENELNRQPIKEEEEEKIQAKTALDFNPEVDSGIENQIQSIKGGGRPLSEGERTFFEPRFGADFSQVRVHTDTQAAEAARGVNARTFTMGHDVVFGNGEYAPGTGEGRRLMGHEPTHVIQQKNTAMFTNTEQNRQNGFIAQSFENETERNSRAIKSSDPLVNMPTSNKSIMRMSPEHTSSSSSLPYDTTYGPSTENCAIYQSPLGRTWFTYSYRNNAECACLNTPDEPHNNCVRKCLQVKMRAHLARLSRAGAALPLTIPLEADPMCHDMWEQHVECYRECGCNNEFINYPTFSVMCRMPFPCFFVGGSISWFNACI